MGRRGPELSPQLRSRICELRSLRWSHAKIQQKHPESLTLNFVGEFMSLYGVFERIPLLGVLASSSIVFSAAYTIYMFNRIAFGGSFSKDFRANLIDINKREFYILFTLVLFTVVLGIYPAPILDGLHYSTSSLIYSAYNL